MILISVATEPFIQQIVSFQDIVTFRSDPRVQIPFARRWSGATENSQVGDYATSDPTGMAPDSSPSAPTALTRIEIQPGDDLVLLVDSYGTVTDIRLDIAAQAATLFGLSADSSHIAQQLPTVCPSGNCTWPPYVSLAVCSSCADVSSMLSHAPKQDSPMAWLFAVEEGDTGYRDNAPQNLTTYFLPNGLNIDNRAVGTAYGMSASPVIMTTLGNLRPSESLTFRSSTTLLYSISILRVPVADFPLVGVWQSSNPAVQAMECGLYLCLREYTSKVQSGTLIETAKEIASTRSAQSFQVAIQEDQNVIRYEGVNTTVDALYSNNTYFPRTDLQIDVPEELDTLNHVEFVNISQAGIDGLSTYLTSLFEDSAFYNITLATEASLPCSLGGSPLKCGVLRNVTGMAIGPIAPTNFAPAAMQVLWNSVDLTATFANLADSLSNELRKNADGQPMFNGHLGRQETVVTVRWAWIALPVFCVVVSLAFFVLSMWESHLTSIPLWKSSSLAPLYHGLDADIWSTLARPEMISQMSRAAEDIHVRLVGGGGQGKYIVPWSHIPASPCWVCHISPRILTATALLLRRNSMHELSETDLPLLKPSNQLRHAATAP